MSEEDETTYIEYIESTVLEQINGSQQISRRSFVTSSNSSNKTGADEDKWHRVKLCPTCAGSVLDCGKNSSSKYWQYLEVALLSVVVVVVLLLMLLPTIFYNLPMPVSLTFFTFYVCLQYHVIVFSSTNRPFPSWYNSRHIQSFVFLWEIRLTVWVND